LNAIPATAGSISSTYLASSLSLTTPTLTSPVTAGTPTGVGVLTSGTAQASTSGTSIDFTSIPSWVKRVTVMFDGVSTNGASPPLLQIGTASGVETSNYAGISGLMHSTGANTYTGITSGIVMAYSTMSAATTYSGSLTINLLNSTTNTWVFNGALYASSVLYLQCFAGSKSLANTLTRVRITTVNGTDAFDAGSINILYE
jgi:hypothetical protein